MGQKVHPIGFRLGITKDWQSRWYADKHYTELLQEDLKIRGVIASKYGADDIARVEIERASNQVTVTVHTSRPGIVIGRGGQRVDEARTLLEQAAGKRVRLNIQEVSQPEVDASLVARSITQQIERRISHRRAMKQAIFRAMERGAQGIKIACSGRLGNSEYARRETLHEGRVPLHTLRADIDYAGATAHTTLGTIGVKVWIYKGDIIPEYEKFETEAVLSSAAEGQDKGGEGIEGTIVSTETAEVAEGVTEEKAVVAAETGEKPKAASGGAKVGEGEEAPKKRARAKSKDKVDVEEAKPAEDVTVEKQPKAKVKTRAKAKVETEGASETGLTEAKEGEAVVEEVDKKEKPKSKGKAKIAGDKKDDTVGGPKVEVE